MKFSKAILDATETVMKSETRSVVFGLGVTDPKRIFGTTDGLVEKFGKDRVFDMPLAENGMTGVAIGLAARGFKVLYIHQRLDFYLLAMDQLVNTAAKWHMMYGGETFLPITIRLIVGRGWGQGPTHSQALHSWFAHIPGLKVVMPSNPSDAKGLLIESMLDPNPVLFIEHRWLHNMEGDVPTGRHCVPIGRASVASNGTDLTIVAISLMVAEALRAKKFLQQYYGVEVEVIDMRSIRPIDWDTIFISVSKTRRLLVLDIGHETGSIASEVISRVASVMYSKMRSNPQKIGLPDFATPTTYGLTKTYYPDAVQVIKKVGKMLDIDVQTEPLQQQKPDKHDIPGSWFNGPF
jgi:acetoin:2,6-dichlorophenolindophenol oxidoreductase subunit beta